MRMKAIEMPKVVIPNPEAPQIRRRSAICLTSTAWSTTTPTTMAVLTKTMCSLTTGICRRRAPSGHSYKMDKLKISVIQPFLLQELKSFAAQATSTTHMGSLMYGKTFLASKFKSDPLLTLTRATSLPHDLFHGKFAERGLAGSSVSFADSPSRPNTTSRGGSRKELSLMEQGPSQILSPKPNVEQKDDREYICVLPLYQWIVVDEDTLMKYDIGQIQAWEDDEPEYTAHALHGPSLTFGVKEKTSSQNRPTGKRIYARSDRELRLRGRDSVDLASRQVWRPTPPRLLGLRRPHC